MIDQKKSVREIDITVRAATRPYNIILEQYYRGRERERDIDDIVISYYLLLLFIIITYCTQHVVGGNSFFWRSNARRS